MADKNGYRLKCIVADVSEARKIQIDDIIRRFVSDFRVTDYKFPEILTNKERAYVHDQALAHGLKSQSYGVGEKRSVTLSKLKTLDRIAIRELELHKESQAAITTLHQFNHNVSDSDSKGRGRRNYNLLALEHIPGNSNRGRGSRSFNNNKQFPEHVLQSGLSNRLSSGPAPQVPTSPNSNRFEEFRKKLPIWQFKADILDKIRNNKVTFIKGDTGCGKTTQVPQFILDDAIERRERVRILCTVPRRIAAISISDRVACERGENVGQSVGYQIRLESRFSPVKTLLTFCTSGVLLRSLSSFDYSILKNTTHIIIDEIHERDRQTDFLIACLRDVCLAYPSLRLILMGADMDSQLMVSYFGGEECCPTFQIHGRLFPVNILFLEDILDILDYKNRKMKNPPPERGLPSARVQNLVNQLNNISLNDENGFQFTNEIPGPSSRMYLQEQPKAKQIPSTDLDEMIVKVWRLGDRPTLRGFIRLVEERNASINYTHQETQATMLMACAARGWSSDVARLLQLGADSSLKIHIPSCNRSFSAQDWAAEHGHTETEQVIIQHEYQKLLLPLQQTRQLSEESQERLQKYLRSVDDDRVDLNLILVLIHHIHTCTDLSGAILVFLPGYEEIITLKEMLFNDPRIRDFSDFFKVFLLHSNIQSGDQRTVFESLRNIRKIVLSTNIAETSLTIEDIVYVIDSGKVKDKSFDSITGISQLKSNWISKASANQRQGRAGRCQSGICYRLYSSSRYESFSQFPVPEIVRSSLQELCLFTRSFVRKEMKIQDFFNALPEPPAPIAVKKSIDMLISMGALNNEEQLTKLGLYLLDLPIEPSLGKALMYAIVLKCLDPVLTIVTMISYRDPFQLPGNPDEKKKAQDTKFEFSYSSMSDHLAALRAFQEWEKSKLFRLSVQMKFCRDNYVSASCFEMVYGIRSQILSQLRASGFIQSTGHNDLVDLNKNSNCWPIVKAVLTATIFPNICYLDAPRKCLFNNYEAKVNFHQGATALMRRKLQDIPSPWVLYDEMCQQGIGKVIRNCTVVGDLAVAVFAGNFTLSPEAVNDEAPIFSDGDELNALMPNNGFLKFDLNHWITFRGSRTVIESVLYMRNRLQDLIYKRLQSPATINTPADETTIRLIVHAINSDDLKHHFINVTGIGQWPKFVSGNMMSVPRAGFDRGQVVTNDDLMETFSPEQEE